MSDAVKLAREWLAWSAWAKTDERPRPMEPALRELEVAENLDTLATAVIALAAEVERMRADIERHVPPVRSVSVWYMHDNHTFKRLEGDIDAVVNAARQLALDSPYGMLGSVILVTTDGKERRAGIGIHARTGFTEADLAAWRDAALADHDVARLLAPASQPTPETP